MQLIRLFRAALLCMRISTQEVQPRNLFFLNTCDIDFPLQCVWTAWIRENSSERSLKASEQGSVIITISNVVV